MWLVLCDRGDVAAIWARNRLLALGLSPVELVTSDVLACALRWDHRVGHTGASVDIVLAGGRHISGNSVKGALNRLVTLPSEQFQNASPADRDYAVQELYALFLSWLEALPGAVLNRPSANGLSGPWRPVSEWVWLAGRASLPTSSYLRSHTDPPEIETGRLPFPLGTVTASAIVVGDEVVGRRPPGLDAGCLRLARLTRSDILGVDFAHMQGAWRFVGATPVPDLRVGGSDCAAALLRALTATPP
jgi:hypothetical protein